MKIPLRVALYIFLFSSFFIPVNPIQGQENINFQLGNFNNWEVKMGYRDRTFESIYPNVYSKNDSFPKGTLNAIKIPEYSSINTGTVVVSSPFYDNWLETVLPNSFPNYKLYKHVAKLGSSLINSSYSLSRQLTYELNIPLAPDSNISEPFFLKYTFALVLEDGLHQTNEQPLFKTKIIENGVPISGSEFTYQIPTKNGIVDEAAAKMEGFIHNTIVPSPNYSNSDNKNIFRVWVKDWQEVYVNLTAYRGKKVQLIFEDNNCLPTGHFCYAYIALRDDFTQTSSTRDTLFSKPNREIIIDARDKKMISTSLSFNIPTISGWKSSFDSDRTQLKLSFDSTAAETKGDIKILYTVGNFKFEEIIPIVVLKNLINNPSVPPLIDTTNHDLSAKIYSNPSHYSFNITLLGDNHYPIYYRIVDYNGNLLLKSNSWNNETITVGESFQSGLYFLELIQGTKRKVIKLLKQ